MLTNAEQRLIALRDTPSGDTRLDLMKGPIIERVLAEIDEDAKSVAREGVNHERQDRRCLS